jgi:hypothetical protein
MKRAALFLMPFAVAISIAANGSRSEDAGAAAYEAQSACDKQAQLFERAQATRYETLPGFSKLGLFQLLGLAFQNLKPKGNHASDFAPEGWRKYLHRRGVLAKVRIVPRENRYTGLFQGAECSLLRLSLTFKPAGRKAVAPGLALKILRDGVPSANVSALVSLEGQGKDFNFLANPLSNIVPIGTGFGLKQVHKIFKKLSPFPEELLAVDVARVDSHGVPAETIVAPRQLFFVPERELGFSSTEHDVREDLLAIPAGTTLYQLRALPSDRHADFDYSEYTAEKAAEFLAESEHVADIVTSSEFVASRFGDEGIFFKHQLRQ